MNEPPVVKQDERTGPPPVKSREATPRPQAPAPKQLLNRRPTIFLLLFGVMGFLGIPLLVKSTAFSRREKVLWSCVVTLYTFGLMWGTAAIVWWSYTNIRDALQF